MAFRDERSETPQHAQAPGNIAFARLPPAGDRQPQPLKLFQLRELDLLSRLDFGQPLDHPLLERVAPDNALFVRYFLQTIK